MYGRVCSHGPLPIVDCCHLELTLDPYQTLTKNISVTIPSHVAHISVFTKLLLRLRIEIRIPRFETQTIPLHYSN